MKKTKFLFARCLTLLILALLSTNLAWGADKTLTFDLTSNPGGWPTNNSTTLTDYTYTLDDVDYTFALKNVKCNSGYLMLNYTAVLGLPAIEGYKLTKVVAKNSGGCSTSTKVGVSSSSSSESYISGGAIQTWSTTSSSYTYNLSGTSNNTVYYLYVTNKNAQITELALTYEGESAPVAVEAPTFSVAAGNYTEAQTVELSCATEGATIHYTTDGTEPSAESTPYESAITIDHSMTIKAIAIKGDDKSSVATAAYKITTYASLADLVADGDPGETGYPVTVTLTNEMLTDFYTSSSDQQRHGVYLNVGDKQIEIYCNTNAAPEEWIEGGTVSGKLENCTWKNYNGTWELCPENWTELTYNAPTTYNIAIDEIEHGSVSADKTEAAAGIEVTLTPTPSTGYKFGEWNVYKTGEQATKVTVTDNKFTMPAHNVTVSATFEAIPTHEAKFFVNGVQYGETQNVLEGAAVEFPDDPASIGTKKFVGWATGEVEETDDAPELVSSATMGTENLNFYAVFANVTETQEEWTEITSAPEAGTYAILSESYFMKAAISSNRFENGSATPAISNSKLTTAPTEDCIWEISKPDTYYRIKNGDKYAGGTNAKNQGALLTDASADLAKWTIEYNNGFTIVNYGRSQASSDSNNKYLRNNDNNGWATYASGTGKAPRLFKKSGGTSFSGYSTRVVVKELSSISIKTAPEKIEYYVGDNFDPTGLEITLNYSDESTEDVTYAGNEESFTFDPALNVALEVTNTKVIITYNGKPVDQNITVTERPQYTVIYYALGNKLGEEVVNINEVVADVPDATTLTGWTFAGWTENENYAMSNTAPELFDLETPITKTIDLYAVYSKTEGVGGSYTLDYDAETTLKESKEWGAYGTSLEYTATDGSKWVVKAYKNQGMQINTGKEASIKIPDCPANISSIEITCSAEKAVGLSADDYEGSGTITYLVEGTDAKSQTLDCSSESVTGGYIVPKSGSTAITKIVVNYGHSTTTYTITAPRTFTKTISNRKMATLYLDYAVEIPEDVKAYTATDKDVSHTAITLEKITDGIIPANTGVIIYSDIATDYTFTETTDAGSTYENNCLKGVTEKTAFNEVADYNATDYNYYALMAGEGTSVVFRLVSAGSYAANSAYLVLPKTANAKVDFTFDDEPTGIESLQPSTLNPQPSQYNLNGMKVNNNYKGIVIMNGKKYINK